MHGRLQLFVVVEGLISSGEVDASTEPGITTTLEQSARRWLGGHVHLAAR